MVDVMAKRERRKKIDLTDEDFVYLWSDELIL